jgi:serine/threonine-protein kinase RsbW
MRSRPDNVHETGTTHLVIAGDPLSVRAGLICLAAKVPLCDLSADDRGTAELVLGEVLNNIVEHAYPSGPGLIDLWLSRTGVGLTCKVADRGLAMRDGRAPDGALPAGIDGPLEDLPEGGFGWNLIRTLTEDLQYERVQGQNHLTFTIPSGAKPL